MSVCPLCNGLRELNVNCSNCETKLEDSGRLIDFFDDYSPYMEIDLMKMEDGYPDTNAQNKCPHVFHCPNCQKDNIIFINE